MRNTIVNKLLAVFVGSLLLILLALLPGFYMARQVFHTVGGDISQSFSRNDLVADLVIDLERVRVLNLAHVLSSSEREMRELEERRRLEIENLQEAKSRLETLSATSGETEAYLSFTSAVDEFVAVTDTTIALSRAGRKAEAVAWIDNRGTPAHERALAEAGRFRELVRSESAALEKRMGLIRARFLQQLSYLGLTGLALALFLYWLGMRWLARPLRDLARVTDRIAAGDLDVKINVGGSDEIGRLAGSFAEMTHTLHQRFQEIQAILEVSQTLSLSLDLDVVLKRVLESTLSLVRGEAGAVFLLDRNGNLRVETSTILPGKNSMPDANFTCINEAVEKREPVLADTFAGRHCECERSLRCHGFRYVLSVPLLRRDRPIGALAFFAQKQQFTTAEAELAAIIANQAAVAIENARLHTGLREGYLSTIAALVAAVEAKDSYTGNHCERLAGYGAATAQRLGLSPAEVEVMRHACLLHDIGKIGISDSILLKPGRLTEREYAEIKKHPVIGARIVESIPFLKNVTVMLRHHHERYDGQGYPDGLKGEDIPLGARVVAVVDAYEAMTSDRPYREAMSREQAIGELERGAGSQFDPAVVAAFLGVLRAEDNPHRILELEEGGHHQITRCDNHENHARIADPSTRTTSPASARSFRSSVKPESEKIASR